MKLKFQYILLGMLKKSLVLARKQKTPRRGIRGGGGLPAERVRAFVSQQTMIRRRGQGGACMLLPAVLYFFVAFAIFRVLTGAGKC